jgi:hypothetical protein
MKIENKLMGRKGRERKHSSFGIVPHFWTQKLSIHSNMRQRKRREREGKRGGRERDKGCTRKRNDIEMFQI